MMASWKTFLLKIRSIANQPKLIKEYGCLIFRRIKYIFRGCLKYSFILASLLPLLIVFKHMSKTSRVLHYWRIPDNVEAPNNTEMSTMLLTDNIYLHSFDLFDFKLTFFFDALSVFFVFMLVVICSLIFCVVVPPATSWKHYFELAIILLIEYALVGMFGAQDLFGFFICFELTVLPMFLFILLFGTGSNTSKASFWFLIFTLLSSLFLVVPIIWLYKVLGVVNFTDIQRYFLAPHTAISFEAIVLCCSFFLAFSIKVPIMPFHIWLPEVHVEAPTVGSMLLASLLLKIGGYGILRFCIGFFPLAFSLLSPVVLGLLVISIIFSSGLALVQTDVKKIVAYSSIAHMATALVGLISFTESGLVGCLISFFAHGLTAPALFFLIGTLYDRYHTRNILYLSGLSRVMPVFCSMFFFLILSNLSFPGFLNFIGEVNIFLGYVVLGAPSICLLVCFGFGIFLVTAYNLLFFNNLVWGTMTSKYLTKISDLGTAEFGFLFSIVFLLLFWGLCPEMLTSWAGECAQRW